MRPPGCARLGIVTGGALLIPIGLITGQALSNGIVAGCLLRSVAPASDLEVTARRRLIATLRAAAPRCGRRVGSISRGA
jgi:hypothetical protein